MNILEHKEYVKNCSEYEKEKRIKDCFEFLNYNKGSQKMYKINKLMKIKKLLKKMIKKKKKKIKMNLLNIKEKEMKLIKIN